jgi:hypothetical protein
MQKACPLCQSPLQNTISEKQVKPIGFGRKFTMDPINRNYFTCGAVVLVNRQNPDGLLEARCCSASA